MKKGIRVLAGIVLAVLLAVGLCTSGGTPVFAADSLSDLYAKLAELSKEQSNYQANINKAQSEIDAEKLKIVALNGEIQLYEDKISVYNGIIRQLDAEIAGLQAELTKNEEELDTYYGIYYERVRLNYESGTTTYMEVLLGSGSFSDYLTRMDTVEQIMAYDNNLLQMMRDTIKAIEEQKAQVEEKRAENAAVRDQLAGEQQKIKDLRSQSQALVNKLSAKIRQYQAAEDAADKAIEELNKKIDALVNPTTPGPTGAFVWPTPGVTWITSRFGYRTDPFTGATKYHNAIDIGAPYGTALHATNSGTVIAVNWESAGGYYIAIDHGGGISSRYYHLSKQSVSPGQPVARNQIIGATGNSGSATTGPHLHFEIRVNGSPVNPLDYVTPY